MYYVIYGQPLMKTLIILFNSRCSCWWSSGSPPHLLPRASGLGTQTTGTPKTHRIFFYEQLICAATFWRWLFTRMRGHRKSYPLATFVTPLPFIKWCIQMIHRVPRTHLLRATYLLATSRRWPHQYFQNFWSWYEDEEVMLIFERILWRWWNNNLRNRWSWRLQWLHCSVCLQVCLGIVPF